MTSTSAATSLMMPAAPSGGPLPQTASVLAVTARPGQESADLGGLLYAFRRPGTSLALLCLTRGEASPLNSTCARLEAIRPWEVQLAASVVGISSVAVASYPDGALAGHPASELTEQVRRRPDPQARRRGSDAGEVRARAPGRLIAAGTRPLVTRAGTPARIRLMATPGAGLARARPWTRACSRSSALTSPARRTRP